MIPSRPRSRADLEERDPVGLDVLAQADARIRAEDAGEESAALLERFVEERPAVEVEQVEDLVDERGRLVGHSPPLDPRLEEGEVGFAALVESDDLAVDDRLARVEPGRRIEERPEVARRVLLAARPESDAVTVDDRLDAETVPLDLEQPVGPVERRAHERREHRRDEAWAWRRRSSWPSAPMMRRRVGDASRAPRGPPRHLVDPTVTMRRFGGVHIGRALDHDRGQRSVRRRPGGPDIGRERLAEPLLERPEQRLAHCRVVLLADAVACMATAECLDRRHDLVELVEALHDDRQGLHEDLALGIHVGPPEEPLDGRVELEQAAVEQASCGIRDGLDGCPTAADQADVGRGHRRRSSVPGETTAGPSPRAILARRLLIAASSMVGRWHGHLTIPVRPPRA